MQFRRHFEQCFHIVREDLEDAPLRLGQPLRLVRHAADLDEEIVCRTVPWGELEAAFDAGRGLLHQLIFVQIQSVLLVFVLEIEIVEIVVEVEVLVFLGAIIEFGEIQLRHVLPDQGLGQRPFLGLQSRAAFQVGDVLGPVLDGYGRTIKGTFPGQGPETIPAGVDGQRLGHLGELPEQPGP